MKILVTGFDPFGEEKINPAWEAVKLLPSSIGKFDVVTAQIPTVFKNSVDSLLELIKKENPSVVLCIGQAGGRFDLTIERVGINIDDARIPDNQNNQPIDVPIYEDGDNAYFSNLPIKTMMQAVKDIGIPCSISNTAGTFVCNHILYALMYHINKFSVVKAGGFVHVPYIPAQVVTKANQPSMSIPMIRDGIAEMIGAIDLFSEDQEITGGAEH